MTIFVARRLFHALFLFFGVAVLLFLLLEVTPGDPVQAIVGQFPVPDTFRQAIEEKYHLNDPFHVRLSSFLLAIVKGDLGYSFVLNQPVIDAILSRLPNTLVLAFTGFGVGIAIGGLFGIIGGITKSRKLDLILSVGIISIYSVPVFWLGQVLVILFSVKLNLFPAQGMEPLMSTSTGIKAIGERIHYLILPGITYGLYEAARFSRIIRTSVKQTVMRGYITTARLKGLNTREVVMRHVLRNASIPIVSVIGYAFGVAMGGTVLIEYVFSWPGLGMLLIDAITQRDNQTILGVVITIALSVIVINFIVDILHSMLDPRIRL